MTFKQLLFQCGWLNIEATLLGEYPHRKAQLSHYETVYQTLLLLPEGDTDLQICIEQKEDSESHACVEVTGSKQTRHITEAQLIIPYSLHYTSWSEWLAMPVSAKSLQAFSTTEIIAHCLVEMTYISFDEENIQAAVKKMSSAIDRMDANDYLNFTSWEDMLKQLNFKAK